MPEIKASIGAGLTNSHDDVALIQAMLVVVKNAKGTSYLNSYDGVFGNHTKNAIIAFQNDQVFKQQRVASVTTASSAKPIPIPAPTPTPSLTPIPATAANAKLGVISPNDVTFKQLLSMLPTNYKELNVLPGGKTVYLSSADGDRKASCANINTEGQLNITFRGRVAKLIDEVFSRHKLAIWVVPGEGRRRTFEQQYKLTFTPNTKAGPGESNHNYGQAVDIGFKGLRWLKANGTIVENEDYWLHKLDPKQTIVPEAACFWKAMQTVATGAAGLFRGPAWDQPHIQAWNDHLVSMNKRLGALLALVGAMKWTGHNGHYQTDFGLGGKFYDVGTAKQIWEKSATVDNQMLASARTDALKKAAMIAGPASSAWKNFKAIAATDIKQTEIDAVKISLRTEFDRAEQNWTKWTPF